MTTDFALDGAVVTYEYSGASGRKYVWGLTLISSGGALCFFNGHGDVFQLAAAVAVATVVTAGGAKSIMRKRAAVQAI